MAAFLSGLKKTIKNIITKVDKDTAVKFSLAHLIPYCSDWSITMP